VAFDGDVHPARAPGFEIGELGLEGRDLGQDRAGGGEEAEAGGREPEGLGGAHEEGGAGLILDPADLVGEGGLGEAEGVGGRGEAPRVVDRLDGAEVAELYVQTRLMIFVRIMSLSHMRRRLTTEGAFQGAAMSRPAVSFEFFPPRNLEGSFRLWDCVNVLGPMGPDFVSVTYGAGGTTRASSPTRRWGRSTRPRDTSAAHPDLRGRPRGGDLAERRGLCAEWRDGDRGAAGRPAQGAEGSGACRGVRGRPVRTDRGAGGGKFTPPRWGAYPEKHPEAGDARQDIEFPEAAARLRGASSGHHAVLLPPETVLSASATPACRPGITRRSSRGSCRSEAGRG
jgi:hypothetical protein